MMQLRLVVALTVLAASNVAGAGRIKVAVVPGIAVNIDAARVDALSQDLAEALTAELDIDAVGGLEVRRALPPDGLPADCVTKPSCTADVAHRTGATQLLFVVMVDSGGAVQVDTTWVDALTGQQASRPAIDLTSSVDSAAKEKFQAVARALLPDAPVRPKPKAPPTTVHLDTSMTTGTPRHLTRGAYLTGALAIAGLADGVAFGIATRSHYNSCSAMPTACTSSKKSTIRSLGIAADAGFLVATGAVIATVVLYATSEEAPHVIVAPTPTGGAVSYTGSF